MKVCAVLVMMAGLQCASHTTGAGNAVSKREACLRHLESCPKKELRRRLEFRFANNDIMDVWEVVNREGIYSRVKGEKLDGYFGMLGMMLTDGALRSRYVSVFWTNGLDVSRDEGMIRVLMGEMVDGEIWKEVSRKLTIMASKRLEEEGRNNGEARAESDGVPDVVNQIAWRVERLLLSKERRWGRMLVALLGKKDVEKMIVEGRCNEELLRMMREDGELKSSLCGYVLERGYVLRKIVKENKVLGKEIMENAIEQGCWLYIDGMEEMLRELFAGEDVFGKIRRKYGIEEEGLSIGRLKVLEQEGRLDGLLEAVIERLVRYGIYGFKDLMEPFGERAGRILSSKKLDAALKEGAERLIRAGWIDDLKELMELSEKELDELLSSEELDAAAREGAEGLIRSGGTEGLKDLMELWEKEFNELLSSEKLDAAAREGAEGLIRNGYPDSLKDLMEFWEKEFNELLSSEELDAALKEGAERLIRNGSTGDLKELMELSEKELDELLSSEELDAALKEGAEKVIRTELIGGLKKLMEFFGERFDRILKSGELDGVLKEVAKEVVRRRWMYGLESLVEIEEVRVRVLGGLLSGDELDVVERLTGMGLGGD